MKKLFVIAIVTLALGACGGKNKKEDTTMENKGGEMGETGGQTYGATPPAGDPTTPANPCGGGAPNPCAPQ